MKTQEVFNSVVRHLYKQGRRATTTTKLDDGTPGCVMRNRTGTLKCAVGSFLTKDQAALFDSGANNITDSSADSVARLVRTLREYGMDEVKSAYTPWGKKLKSSQIAAIESLPSFLETEEHLLSDLQEVHDSEESWNSKGFIGYDALVGVALTYKLNTKVLEEYKPK